MRGIIAWDMCLTQKDVKAFFAALNDLAYKEVKETGKFLIPGIVIMKLKQKKPWKASMKMMMRFGQRIRVAAKPARKVVKIYATKTLQDNVVAYRAATDCELVAA